MRFAVVTALFILGAGAAGAAEPIAYAASSQAFGEAMAKRYVQGGDYAAAKADLEANGFVCEARPAQPATADAPTHECIKNVVEANCNREYAVELREGGGALRRAAVGSNAAMCLGGVLPPKRKVLPGNPS